MERLTGVATVTKGVGLSKQLIPYVTCPKDKMKLLTVVCFRVVGVCTVDFCFVLIQHYITTVTVRSIYIR